ncbi:16652_t:CDS:2 [Entrophospora sp. SA101]|nr:16652_t:CDS:2 [Entrophospora sp. SA101]
MTKSHVFGSSKEEEKAKNEELKEKEQNTSKISHAFASEDEETIEKKEKDDHHTTKFIAGDVTTVEQALAVFDTDEDKCNYLRTYLDFLKPDISNKRRRIGDSNEELGAWNALKSGTKENQFLRLSKEASYILGDDDKGSNPPALFIRDCYIHLSEIILEDDNIRRLRITGNPGIGKTFFGYYLLHLLAMRNKTVIYHKCNKTPILFSEEAVYHIYQDNIYEFNDFLMKRDVWYIVDGREPSDIHAKTILICSPQKHYYHKFDKLGTIIRYMPVWSYVEIKKCKDKLFPDLNQELVQSLYNKWGGIPRYTLYYALNDSQQDLLQMAISTVNQRILNFVGETTDDDDTRHRIVHISTNVPQAGEYKGKGSAVIKPEMGKDRPFYTMSILEFASDYVSEKVVGRLTTHYRNQLLNFVESSSLINEYSTLRGAIFEQIAHQKLLSGKSFRTRPLFEQTSSFGNGNSRFRLPARDKLLFNNIKEIAPNKYCIPTQKNFASVDAIIHPNIFFSNDDCQESSYQHKSLAKTY